MRGPEICFILYKPAVPGNIGAAARAIKTMGFSELRLVDPADHLSGEARMMAHGSHDILENSKLYATFEEAVADIDFVICTTAKRKNAKVDYIPSGELQAFIAEKIPVTRRIGIVFGTEESGLPNAILLVADAGVTIPMATNHPSLNLAQSVMVIAYELSGLLRDNVSIRTSTRVSGGAPQQRGTGNAQQQQETSDAPRRQETGTAQQQPETSDAPQRQETGTAQQQPETSEVPQRQETGTAQQQPETWRQLRDRTATILQQAGIQPGTPLYHRIMERMSFLKASDARLAHSVTSKVMEIIKRPGNNLHE